jgi:hypothetical protein
MESLIPMAGAVILSYSSYLLVQKTVFLVKKKVKFIEEVSEFGEFGFHIYNIVVISAFLLPFLFIGGLRGVRYLGISLLVSIFLLMAQGRYKIILVLVIINVTSLPSLINEYRSLVPGYRTYENPSHFSELEKIVEEHIIYQPSANAWCNSLLLEDDPRPFVVIPAGIGIAAKFRLEITGGCYLPRLSATCT